MSLITKIRKALLLPIRKIRYGSFGFNSDIIHPFLISGASSIYIGNKTTIRNFARIEAITSYKSVSEGTAERKEYIQRFSPKLLIGNNVVIEQGVHLVCSKNLAIGDDTTISSYVFISDSVHSFQDPNVNILNQPLISSPVIIGKKVFIGTGAKILPGVTIGDGAIIGANAVVTHDIPARVVVAGVPARILKRHDPNTQRWIQTEE